MLNGLSHSLWTKLQVSRVSRVLCILTCAMAAGTWPLTCLWTSTWRSRQCARRGWHPSSTPPHTSRYLLWLNNSTVGLEYHQINSLRSWTRIPQIIVVWLLFGIIYLEYVYFSGVRYGLCFGPADFFCLLLTTFILNLVSFLF